MALGIIHYGFAIVSVISFICAFTILQRYLKIRNNLSIPFVLFLVGLAIDSLFFFLRGFYDVGVPEEIFLWQLTNVMYVAMTLPLVAFLLYPMYIQRKTSGKGFEIVILMVIFIVVSIFDLAIIAFAEIIPTYVDPYGLAHYSFDSFIPSTYYISLGIVIFLALFASFLLGLTAYRESEIFYKRRALLIMIGWLACVFGQILLLSPALAIANPVVLVIGAIIIAIGVIRTPPS